MDIKTAEKNINRIMVALILALVFLAPVILGWQETLWNAFTLPKVALFRIIASILLVLGATKVLLSSRLSVKRSYPLFLFLGLLAGSWILSSFLSVDPDLSLWGRYDRMQGLFTLIYYLLFFLLLVLFLGKYPTIKKILGFTALASAFVAGYGIIQYAGWDPLVWSEKTSFPDGRIISTLGQPNFLAHFLVLVIPVSVFLFKFSAGRVKKFLLAGLILIQVLALVFTFSRAGWLALAAGVFLALAGIFLILKRKRALYILSAAAVVAVIAVLGLNVWSSTPSWEDSGLSDNYFLSRVAGIANLDQGSTRMRIYYWQASWEEFRQTSLTRKLVGYGPDTLGNIFAGHYEKDWGVQESLNTYPNRAHNFFFDTLLSFGLVGVAAGVLFFGYILLQAVRYLKTGREQRGEEYWLVFTLFIIALIYGSNNLFSFSNTTTYVYFYTFLGILAALIFKKEKEIKLNISRISGVAIIVVLTVFSAIFIVFYNIDLARADLGYMEARKIMAEEGGDPRKKCFFAINGINSAIELNTVHNFYKKEYLRLSLNCFSKFVLARPKVKENILYEIRSDSRQERNYDLDLYAARVYSLLAASESSYYDKAEKIYRDLIEFSPYITTPYKELARLKLQQKEAKEAIFVLKQAIEITPSPRAPYSSREHELEAKQELGYLYELLGRAYKIQGEEDSAVKARQKAQDLKSFE